MRRSYLDNIRWITVVLVVCYHVFYMYNGEGIPGGLGRITGLDVQYYDVYQYIVYPWFMMLLFVVSGISSAYLLEKCGNREFIRNRTTRLLVPSTVGLFVFHFIQGYISMGLAGALAVLREAPRAVGYMVMVLSGISILWYIQMLWVLSLLLVLIRIIERDRIRILCKRAKLPVLILLAAAVWAAGQVLNTPVVTVYRFGLYAATFLAGYFIFSHSEVIEILKKWFWPLTAAAVILGFWFCKRWFGENFADVPVNRTVLFAVYGWFACLAILGGMARYGDGRTVFTEWMRQRSFGLYVFHYLGISSVALFLGKSGQIPAAAVYLLSLAAGFAAGYALNALISRIPFWRWAVLGIRRKKEENHVSG